MRYRDFGDGEVVEAAQRRMKKAKKKKKKRFIKWKCHEVSGIYTYRYLFSTQQN